MIYDTFQFSHELLLLEARLNILSEVIDKFIIVESQLTHSLKPKPLFFYENKSKFEKFQDKIIYVVAQHEYKPFIYNDYATRQVIYQSIPNPQFNDIILHSDIDEIPKPQILKETIQNLSVPISFNMDNMCWTVDLYATHSWHGSILMKYGWIKDVLYKYRENRNNSKENYFKVIEDSGKHYSYLGPIDNILRKFDSYTHSEEINNSVKTRENILYCIKNKLGFERKPSFPQVELNEQNVFNHLLNNKDYYKEFFHDYYINLV